MNTSLRLARRRPLPGTLVAARRRAVGLGSAALVVASLAPTAVAGASPSRAAGTTPMGLPVVSGVLSGGDGSPVAGRVHVLIDPGAQPVGTDVTVPVVASATAGADGRYELALAPDDPAVAAALARNHGWVNVLIVAEGNGFDAMTEAGRTTAGNLSALAPSAGASSALPAGTSWVDRNGFSPSVDFTLAAGRPGVSAMSPAQVAAAAAVQPERRGAAVSLHGGRLTPGRARWWARSTSGRTRRRPSPTGRRRTPTSASASTPPAAGGA